jgi:hypothetical protein
MTLTKEQADKINWLAMGLKFASQAVISAYHTERGDIQELRKIEAEAEAELQKYLESLTDAKFAKQATDG